MDLCFVPATHKEAEAVPAVSGSSGRLVVSAPKRVDERSWPGQVFEKAGLSYGEAMDQFVREREAARAKKQEDNQAGEQGSDEEKAARQELRTLMQGLQIERRRERERRRLIDQAWKVRKQEQKLALERSEGLAMAALSGPAVGKWRERGRRRAGLRAQWRAEWGERHKELERRRQEDARWRQEREKLGERKAGIGLVTVWVAILVMVDNCSRRCLGLPLFEMGAHVTAELVVEALGAILPRELKYLISDGGQHFSGEALKKLAKGQGFVRVPLARHRPQSNGIAERFIETLKGWLAERDWQAGVELRGLLNEFLVHYNDRPHQGLELAGLSPNEYVARRLAV